MTGFNWTLFLWFFTIKEESTILAKENKNHFDFQMLFNMGNLRGYFQIEFKLYKNPSSNNTDNHLKKEMKLQ